MASEGRGKGDEIQFELAGNQSYLCSSCQGSTVNKYDNTSFFNFSDLLGWYTCQGDQCYTFETVLNYATVTSFCYTEFTINRVCCLPPPTPKLLLRGNTDIPREIKDNAYTKLWGTNKVYYGRCENGEQRIYLV